MTSAHTHGHTDPAELVELGAYRRSVLERIAPLEPISLGLTEAHGCVLAADVVSAEDVPGFANSAVDGYAVVLDGFVPSGFFEVVGETAAGAAAGTQLRPGTAIRVMTGAPVPDTADAVIPVELVEGDDAGEEASVRFRITPAPGENIRPAGESVRSGDRVLAAGHVLDAAAIGMLAAVGRAAVPVHPAPRVAVLSTGDELVGPEAVLAPGQIRDSNSWALAAAVREAGGVPFRVSGVADRPEAVREAVEEALVHVDLVVSTGGVSAGRYDYVKRVLAELGDVRSTKVAMKPGMPQAFGFVQDIPCFGLPGNPVSALVSFEVFVRPAIRRLQGRSDLSRPRLSATLVDPLTSPAHKYEFVRVRLERQGGGWLAASTGAQGSGILRSLVEADGLAEVPPDVTELAPGARVTVHRLRTP